MRIIPAIDLIEGQCVRLTHGDYNTKKIYNTDPVEVAREFADHGIKYLHLVDLDGAKKGEVVNLKVLERICSETNLIVDFGGGLRTTESVEKVFSAGARQVTGGSIAVKNPELFESWLSRFGGEAIILGADAKNGNIAIQGWTESTALPVEAYVADYMDKGVKYVICTDISRDGALTGPAVELYASMLKSNPGVKLIASGGIADITDLDKLKALKMDGVIIGKAIYENRISLKQLEDYVD